MVVRSALMLLRSALKATAPEEGEDSVVTSVEAEVEDTAEVVMAVATVAVAVAEADTEVVAAVASVVAEEEEVVAVATVVDAEAEVMATVVCYKSPKVIRALLNIITCRQRRVPWRQGQGPI